MPIIFRVQFSNIGSTTNTITQYFTLNQPDISQFRMWNHFVVRFNGSAIPSGFLNASISIDQITNFDGNNFDYQFDNISLRAINTNPPVITTQPTASTVCSSPCNGSALATVTGGNAPFTYSWSSGATARTALNLCPNTYTVSVIDAQRCTNARFVNVTGTINASVSPLNPGICPGSSASLTAAGSGGTAPYTYSWSNGAVTAATTVSPVLTTTYTVTVRDNKGCAGTRAVTVTLNLPPQISAASNNCTTSCSGEAVVNVTSGVAPYTYTWSNGANTSTNSGLCTSGVTYTVTVTDARTCRSTTTVTMNSSCCTNFTALGTVCSGAPAVTLSATPAGGTFSGPYVSGTTFNPPVVTSTTTYTLTYTAACGTSKTQTITVSNEGNCCYNGTAMGTTLKVSQSNKPLRIADNATVTINGNVILNNCDLVMGANAKIIIPSNATLTLTSTSATQFTHLHACGDMWDGIYIQGNGNLIVNKNTLIEDAKNAVVAVAGSSKYTFDGAIFNKNYKSIIYSPSTVNSSSTRKIVNSVFTCRVLPGNPTIAQLTATDVLRGYPVAALKAPYATQKSHTGIDINSVSGTIYIGVRTSPINTFDNLTYGVWAHSSNVYIRRNTFQFIERALINNQLVGGVAVIADAPAGDNNFILQVGGSLTNELNTFTGSCTNAVDVTEYAQVAVLYNNISYYEFTPGSYNPYATGIYAIKMITSASKNINVHYNTINNYNTAIAGFRQGTNNATGSYVIKGNRITANPLIGGAGISISDLTVSSTVNNITIDNNTISDVGTGITLTSVKASALIYKNTITLNPNSFAPYYDAIGLYDTDTGPGGSRTRVDANTINGQVYSPTASNINVRGIYASLSPNSIINCNIVNNTGRSIVFNNACGGTGLLNNTLNTAYDGIVLTNSGIIGTQGTLSSASDNIWAGAGTTAANFVNSQTYAEQSFGSTSPFYVIGSSPGYNPLSAKNKFTNPGSPFSFNNTALPSIGCAAPGPGGGGDVSSFAAPTPTTTTGTLDQQMRITAEQYPVYSTQSVFLNNQNAYEYLQNNASLKTGKYKKYSDSLSSKAIGMFYKFNNAVNQKNAKLAKNIKSSLTPINDIEQHQQTINNYLADALTDGNYTLARNEKSKLRAIAAKCPLTAGRSVYQARVLYNMLIGRDTTFVEICKDNFANARLAQKNSDGDSAIPMLANPIVKLYPNPNGGTFIVEYTINEEADAMLEIFDITGKIVDALKLNGKTTFTEVNENGLENGVYYYRVSINGTPFASNKLVIVK